MHRAPGSAVRSFVRVAAALGLVALAPAGEALAQSVPAAVHQIESNGRGSVSPGYTLGWDFRVTQQVFVTELGFFDMLETTAGSIGDGLYEAHQVGIWTDDGTLVVSGTVLGGTDAPLEAGFRYVTVPETELQPNTTYIVGAHFPSSCNFIDGGAGDCSVAYVPGGILTPPKFTWHAMVSPIGRRWGSGWGAPLGTGESPSFGPSFKFVPGSEPPPPPVPPGETVISDPLGDFQLLAGPLPPGAPNPPDLLELSAGFDSVHLVVRVVFAPATLQPGAEGLFYVLGLDLDLNLLTGGSFIPGADALLLFSSDLQTATICDGSLTPASCVASVPVTVSGDELQLEIPLGASGIDDDGVLRFGFVAGLFVDGVPVSEDAAFDGVSGSLERNLVALAGRLMAPPPVPGLGTAGSVMLALALASSALVAARARARA